MHAPGLVEEREKPSQPGVVQGGCRPSMNLMVLLSRWKRRPIEMMLFPASWRDLMSSSSVRPSTSSGGKRASRTSVATSSLAKRAKASLTSAYVAVRRSTSRCLASPSFRRWRHSRMYWARSLDDRALVFCLGLGSFAVDALGVGVAFGVDALGAGTGFSALVRRWGGWQGQPHPGHLK